MTKLITIAPLDDDGTANGLYHYKICGLDNYWLTPNLYERGLTEGETLHFRACLMYRPQSASCLFTRQVSRQGGSVPAHRYWLHKTELGSVLGYKDKQRVAAAERLARKGKEQPTSGLTGRFVAETCLSGLARATAAGRVSLQAPCPDAGPGPAGPPFGRADLKVPPPPRPFMLRRRSLQCAHGVFQNRCAGGGNPEMRRQAKGSALNRRHAL